MLQNFSIGYIYYSIFLFFISGGLVLAVDANLYKRSGMVKELKTTRFLAWVHIIIACLLMVANWMFELRL